MNLYIKFNNNSSKVKPNKKQKKFYLVALLIILITFASSYNKLISNFGAYFISSTDLTNIYIDDISLGNTLDSLDLSQYTHSDKYSNENYNLIFDELMISEENNTINKIYGRFNKVKVKVNDTMLSKNIDTLDSILGTSYIKATYDTEQLTSQRIYIDKENKIKATFIYQTLDSGSNIQIITIIVEKL